MSLLLGVVHDFLNALTGFKERYVFAWLLIYAPFLCMHFAFMDLGAYRGWKRVFCKMFCAVTHFVFDFYLILYYDIVWYWHSIRIDIYFAIIQLVLLTVIIDYTEVSLVLQFYWSVIQRVFNNVSKNLGRNCL